MQIFFLFFFFLLHYFCNFHTVSSFVKALVSLGAAASVDSHTNVLILMSHHLRTTTKSSRVSVCTTVTAG